MHFLGLAGMPRRIPHYPDAYWKLNYLSSFGSIISTLSTILFFYIIIETLTSKPSIIQDSLFIIEKKSKDDESSF